MAQEDGIRCIRKGLLFQYITTYLIPVLRLTSKDAKGTIWNHFIVLLCDVPIVPSKKKTE